MTVVHEFFHRAPAEGRQTPRRPAEATGRTAEIHILPCIRYERIDADLRLFRHDEAAVSA